MWHIHIRSGKFTSDVAHPHPTWQHPHLRGNNHIYMATCMYVCFFNVSRSGDGVVPYVRTEVFAYVESLPFGHVGDGGGWGVESPLRFALCRLE